MRKNKILKLIADFEIKSQLQDEKIEILKDCIEEFLKLSVKLSVKFDKKSVIDELTK